MSINTQTAINLLENNQTNFTNTLTALGFFNKNLSQIKVDFEEQFNPILEQYEALQNTIDALNINLGLVEQTLNLSDAHYQIESNHLQKLVSQYSNSWIYEVHFKEQNLFLSRKRMKPYSIDFRQKIIEVWQEEKVSIRQLAQRFIVAKSFIQKLIKQYQETGDIRPRPQGGSPPPKLKSEQLIILVEIMEKNNDATLEELCELLHEATGVKVGKTTMGRISQHLNYSVKKKTLYAPEKYQEKVQQKRVEYWQEIREVQAENLVFIDESGVNLARVRLYARSLKGTRARGERPQKRGKNISIIGALSLEKVLAITPIYGAVDGVTFEAFMSKELVAKLWKDACVVMDNAKIH